MSIRLYDSKAQATVDFVPREAGKVGMYVCGPTVQSSPHIGHLRSALAYDLWRRWFEFRGYEVTFVRNVTDVDDKVLANASEAEPWWALAYRVEREFTRGYEALGIRPPTYEPRATASIIGMQDLIGELVKKGHAYSADDGTGDVFFSVASWPNYGALTRQRPDDMVDSADVATRGKRDPRDFALWKGRKPDEPESAAWQSAWGLGRPGWHIECSAMARRYLGSAFDIHGGGLDLRFPHHENELAQSTAAGDEFAKYWVHNGLVNVEGQKMSKSLGNSVYASQVIGSTSPIVLRYYFASAQYRSTIDFHSGALREAEAAFERVRSALDFLHSNGHAREVWNQPWGRHSLDSEAHDGGLPRAFEEAMDDDLNTPKAFAVVQHFAKITNRAWGVGDYANAVEHGYKLWQMTEVLGINPFSPEWKESGETDERQREVLSRIVERLLELRAEAKSLGDYDLSDRLRSELARVGIQIKDTREGVSWDIL